MPLFDLFTVRSAEPTITAGHIVVDVDADVGVVDADVDVDVGVSALLLLLHPIPAELTIAAGHCPREISPPPSLPPLSPCK